ncbi:hypothetical protein CKO28_06075 [Rhodovibrio sodomensis]|uniref:Guanylate cyclase domain-containing protein n=1 Tax=Rhodovibrio sodomensis TaxID=1088 RepID=A0ABS1DAW9_9PROT|nr:hypothetical protein [Rhodovibrio sodomensis]
MAVNLDHAAVAQTERAARVARTTGALDSVFAALRLHAIGHALNIAARLAGRDIEIQGGDPIPVIGVGISGRDYRHSTRDLHDLLTLSGQKLISGMGWGSLHSQIVHRAAAQAARAKDR